LESDFISPTQPGPSKISFFCLVLAMEDTNPLYKLHSCVTPPPKNRLRRYIWGGLPPQSPYINALFQIPISADWFHGGPDKQVGGKFLVQHLWQKKAFGGRLFQKRFMPPACFLSLTRSLACTPTPSSFLLLPSSPVSSNIVFRAAAVF
jgi:hypothetical protein